MPELTCIRCPRGCRLEVAPDMSVRGAGCPQGVSYAQEECTHPVRTVTATVRLTGSPLVRLPVKSRKPVPKEKVLAVIRELEGVAATAPIKVGDTVLDNAAGTGTDIISARTVRERENGIV